MKKSLIALAVMAAAGAASAQSSVQLYGIADIWFGSVKTEAGGVSLRDTKLVDGGVDGSRFGLKGSEDLGGGLKAVFTLEQGFNLDEGTQAAAGSSFSREANVGLAGGFGEIRFGKAWNAFDDISGATATVFDGALTPMNNVFVSTAAADNPANTIKYASPAFGGFSVSGSYSLGENKTLVTDSTDSYALAAKYENGPLFVGAAYASYDQNNTQSADFLRLNAAYNFGVATLKGTYGDVSDEFGNTDTTEYEIGVDVPLSSNLTLSAGYAKSEDENATTGANGNERSGFGAAVAYSLSKRTIAYAGFTQAKTETAAGLELGKVTVYAVGIKHTF